MNRWISCSLVAAVLAGSFVLAGNNLPNILFIAVDDLRPQLGAYGLDYMVTPNLDKLASEGRLFSRHYVQVPTCGPSRACMLTGKNLRAISDISHNHLGNRLAGTSEPEQPETLIHHFKRSGYHTVGMGKISHSLSGHFKDPATNRDGLELPHSWDEFVTDAGNSWQMYAGGKDRKKDEMPPFECLDLEDEAYPDGRLANMATGKLVELAKAGRPFFMAVGFYKPHLPFCAPKKYWDLYDRSKLPLSPNPDLPDGVERVFLHNSNEFFNQYPGNRERGGAGKRLSDAYAREIIHANAAATSYVDAQIGKVLGKLWELGLEKDTIIVVWGDHGWHLGDHTIWGKHSAFERALRSTLIVKVPGMQEPGVGTDGLVASVDIYPTLCELIGIVPPDGLDGESFVPLITDPNAKGKGAVLSYWRDILSMRTERYRLAVFDDGKKREWMLFDHDADPNEEHNVAEQNPEIVSQLMKLILQSNRGFLPGLK